MIISQYKLVSVNANICSICQCLHQAPSATLLSVVGEGQPLMDRSGHCYKNFSVMNPHYTQPYKTLNLLITPMKTHVKLSDLRVMFEFIDCLWCVLVCGVCQWRLQSQREGLSITLLQQRWPQSPGPLHTRRIWGWPVMCVMSVMSHMEQSVNSSDHCSVGNLIWTKL